MMNHPTLLIDLILIIGTLAFIAAIAFMLSSKKQEKLIQQRLHRGSEAKTTEQQIQESLSLRRAQDHSLGHSGFGERLSGRLRNAGIGLTSREYLIRCAVAMVGFSALLSLFVNPSLALLLGFIISFGLPHFVIGFKINRQRAKFLTLFPDAVELIVRGLRAGLPVTESMQNVAREVPAPVSPIFEDITEQIALGVPFDQAMERTAQQLDMTEFNFFVISVILQRETGGNLGEILSNLAEVLRQRHVMKLKVKAMSSEARASATIVGALPVLVLIILTITSPDYLRPMFEDFRGNLAAFCAACLMGFGVFIMTRMAKFRI
jgi:tight adherence protein B